MCKELELNEKNRIKFINKSLPNIQLNNDIVAVNVIINYTTYDSSSAWCMDGHDVIASYIPLHEIKTVIQDYFSDGYDFSNIERIEDDFNYAYGYTVDYEYFTKVDIDELVFRLNKITQAFK